MSAFLRRAARLPFRVGQHDCALFVADWVAESTGRDAAADVRGIYATQQEAAALHGRGGLVGTVTRRARAVGLARTHTPDTGDIGVIECGGTLYCAIFHRHGWIVRADRAVATIPQASARLIAAWRVPVEAVDG